MTIEEELLPRYRVDTACCAKAPERKEDSMAGLALFSWLADFQVWLNVLFPLIAGICVFLVGWYLRLTKGTRPNLKKWRKAMDMWQMQQIVAGEQELRVVALALQHYWYRYVYSACFFGMDISLIALTIGSMLILLAITGNLIGLDVMALQGYDAPIMAALGGLFLIDAGGGAIVIGIWRVQREMASAFNDADLHQRRLSDYWALSHKWCCLLACHNLIDESFYRETEPCRGMLRCR
jgi:hypothetical protein